MKYLSFSRVAMLLFLVVTVASCGLPLYSTDEYYEEAPARRGVYRGSNVYGSGPVVLERDPYTGRLYEVDPYYGRPARPYYDRRYNSRYYNNRRANSGYYGNSPYRNNNTYRSYPQQAQPQPRQQSAQEAQRQRDEAREKILGGKRD